MRNLALILCALALVSGCRKSAGDSGSVKSADATKDQYPQCVTAAGKDVAKAKACDPTTLDDCLSILKSPLSGSDDLIRRSH
jgi:hypothetical protein